MPDQPTTTPPPRTFAAFYATIAHSHDEEATRAIWNAAYAAAVADGAAACREIERDYSDHVGKSNVIGNMIEAEGRRAAAGCGAAVEALAAAAAGKDGGR